MSNKVAEDSSTYGKVSVAELRVVLHNVSWETYERLLEETGDDRRSRMAYEGGNLEIMAPQFEHESSNRFLDRMIFIVAEELGMDMRSGGALTCKRAIAKKSLEPDSCFYIRHENSVRGRDKIDLDKNDPPPDLMIEVDITRSSINKLSICAALGVPEVWRFNGKELRFLALKDSQYVEIQESVAFPGMALSDKMPEIIAREPQIGEMKALREFRTWVKQQLEARK